MVIKSLAAEACGDMSFIVVYSRAWESIIALELLTKTTGGLWLTSWSGLSLLKTTRPVRFLAHPQIQKGRGEGWERKAKEGQKMAFKA